MESSVSLLTELLIAFGMIVVYGAIGFIGNRYYARKDALRYALHKLTVDRMCWDTCCGCSTCKPRANLPNEGQRIMAALLTAPGPINYHMGVEV